MATELGTAYVQIVPSMQGISGSLSKALGSEANSAGDEAGTNFMGSFKAKALALVAGLGIGKLLKDSISASISEGAALQQSLGGVETLFKSSADTVKNYANEAYRTTGLSANKYMESVTGFSASLLQSLGGDTDKAAEVANMALVDMSDNANKMGSSMESIQFAYQGFAKQNYTMLDNLKLGYGGTKQEMQRLLADAEKLTGVKYDLNNLSDVYSAIHAIQENLDITGTTAKEAASTFTGSFESMKAAAQNVLGKIAIGENVLPALEALAQTTSTFLFDNFFPMLGNIFSGMGLIFTEGISKIASNLFGDEFGNAVYTQLSRVTAVFQTFFDMIFGSMSNQDNIDVLEALGFSEDAATQIVNIAENIRVTFENIGSAIADVGSIAVDFIGDLLGIQGSEQGVTILGTAFEILTSVLSVASAALKEITGFFKENQLAADLLKSALVSLGVTMAAVKIAGFVSELGGITGAIGIAKTAITTFATSITASISAIPLIGWIAAATAALAWFFTQTETGKQLWGSFMEWFSGTFQSILPAFTEAWNGITETAVSVWTNLLAVVSPIIQSVVDFIKTVWDGISSWWTENQSLIQQTFETVWNAIQTVIQTVMPVIQTIIENTMNILSTYIELTWNNISTIVVTVWELMKNSIQTAIDAIAGIIRAVMQIINGDWSGAWESIKGVAETLWNGMVNAGKIIFDGFAQILSNIWNVIKSAASAAWEALKASVLSIINNIVSGAQSAWDTMVGAVSALVSAITGFFDQLWNIDLVGAGRAIMDGFLNGLKSAWGAVTEFVGGIASWIAEHKGPIEYDRKLLIPAGKAIMESLDEGLTNKFEAVKDTVSGMASEINDVFNNDITDFDMGATVSKDFKIEDMSNTDVAVNDDNVEVINALEFVIKLLQWILAKDNNIYLDGAVLAKNSYDRQMDFIQREGI
ncbi:MAG: PblA [Granulicatella sp.]|nr:MAG: PblA [Granulicatella sp.]